MEFIDLKSQYQHLKNNIDNRIKKVLDHGKYIMGPEVQELEENLAKYVGVKHAITCANGTDALTLSLMALGIKKGDAVFCPTFTFFATAETIALSGATPIFVDSDPDTFNICPIDLKNKIKDIHNQGELELKAIMTVDLFGLPADYSAINLIANEYNLFVIEDGAQGFGGSINNKKACSFGDISTTSFFPAKPLGCYGDGGAVFTDNDDYAELVKSFRVHGKGKDKYDNVRIGLNSRLDTIQAAILIEKLNAFPQEIKNRQIAAQKYNELYSNKYITPVIPEGYISSWAQYTIKTSNRDEAISSFKNMGIPTMIYYSTCLHNQTAFNYLGTQKGNFPVAEKHAESVLSLPMHGYMDR